MLVLSITLLISMAHAETLDAPLGDKAGAIYVPADKSVTLSIKGAAESDAASWENTDSDAISLVCGAGKAPEDKFAEQLMLQVGDAKWALAPGASVKFTCPDDKPVSVMDVHGTAVASFKGPLLVTIEGMKSKGAR